MDHIGPVSGVPHKQSPLLCLCPRRYKSTSEFCLELNHCECSWLDAVGWESGTRESWHDKQEFGSYFCKMESHVYVCACCMYVSTWALHTQGYLRWKGKSLSLWGCCYKFTGATYLWPSVLICKTRAIMFMNKTLEALGMRGMHGWEEAIFWQTTESVQSLATQAMLLEPSYVTESQWMENADTHSKLQKHTLKLPFV